MSGQTKRILSSLWEWDMREPAESTRLDEISALAEALAADPSTDLHAWALLHPEAAALLNSLADNSGAPGSHDAADNAPVDDAPVDDKPGVGEWAAHFAAYQDVLTRVRDDTLETPPVAGRFSLDYLPPLPQAATAAATGPAAPTIEPDWLLVAGEYVIRFSQQVVDSLRSALGRPEPAMVKSGAEQPLFTWSRAQPNEDVGVEITVRPQAGSDRQEQRTAQVPDAAYVAVAVQVDIPSRGGWPHLHDIDVALTAGETTHRRKTDAFGSVLFADIPAPALPTMTITVTRPDA